MPSKSTEALSGATMVFGGGVLPDDGVVFSQQDGTFKLTADHAPEKLTVYFGKFKTVFAVTAAHCGRPLRIVLPADSPDTPERTGEIQIAE